MFSFDYSAVVASSVSTGAVVSAGALVVSAEESAVEEAAVVVAAVVLLVEPVAVVSAPWIRNATSTRTTNTIATTVVRVLSLRSMVLALLLPKNVSEAPAIVPERLWLLPC